MRDLRALDAFRIRGHPGGLGDETCGMFEIRSKASNQTLRVIASSDGGWDHVSVSVPNRCPNWPEMEQIRRLFFKDAEAVMQYHAPVADYVDGSRRGDCEHCLHLWRPQFQTLPAPPRWMLSTIGLEESA